MHQITYGTVKEYNTFLETLPTITQLTGDLKNFQRPWVVNEILRRLRGGRILEIGADRCQLANFLYERGFETWVIDPYESFGGGTASYEEVRAKFPNILIHKGFLHHCASLPSDYFDAVYSCSVVEHIPVGDMAANCAKLLQILKPGGYSIHAIDLTIDGIMQNIDLVAKFIEHHMVAFDLRELTQKARTDIETFYLSPQGHYAWRRMLRKDYEQYPYRKVISLNLAVIKNSP